MEQVQMCSSNVSASGFVVCLQGAAKAKKVNKDEDQGSFFLLQGFPR